MIADTTSEVKHCVLCRQGLAEQLLNVVVKHERADLEEQRESLIQQMSSNKVLLSNLEESLLSNLSNASGNILDNQVGYLCTWKQHLVCLRDVLLIMVCCYCCVMLQCLATCILLMHAMCWNLLSAIICVRLHESMWCSVTIVDDIGQSGVCTLNQDMQERMCNLVHAT